MSRILDRIGDLYEEQRVLLDRSDIFDYTGAKRQRLQDIAAALPKLWELRRIEIQGGSEAARILAEETMRGNARAIPTLRAAHDRGGARR